MGTRRHCGARFNFTRVYVIGRVGHGVDIGIAALTCIDTGKKMCASRLIIWAAK